MENIYFFIVGILFLLAISDLVVGVSNDAVNFLVSAVGSKAAPFWLIMIVASLGVIFGATFSGGMMEVARKGIFHPDMFLFSEIMVVFLAVMLTDIILLDTFNSLGLPTSTTVSIVFELLGAAVAVAILKTWGATDGSGISEFINTSKALGIISGILISVVVAFTVGALVQYIARIIFSFQNEKSLKYFSAIWSGIAIAFITYFILVKGLKGSTYANIELSNGETLVSWAKHNTGTILVYSFLIWTIVLQLAQWLFKFNPLKFIVLVGTFGLAMAFAGNDLVNFIGVPLAGLMSFTSLSETGFSPDMMTMDVLKQPVQTDPLYLILAGLIMVTTLWVSRKAKSVTATSVNLSRQNEGHERFESTALSRTLVRWAIQFSTLWEKIIPKVVQNAINKRFVQPEITETEEKDAPAFDLIRASVNLVVASILISFATSLKLPLSTTYVTFMVAMGTSLADGAWGRESAVYRITGVLTVIGGWFVTAFVAFMVAGLVASLIYFGYVGGSFWEWTVIILLLALAVYFLVRSQRILKKHERQEAEAIKETEKTTEEDILEVQTKVVLDVLHSSSELFVPTITALHKDNRKELKQINETLNKLKEITKGLKTEINTIVRKLKEDDFTTSHHYVQTVDYLREVSHSLQYIIVPAYNHVDNNHKPVNKNQFADVMDVFKVLPNYFSLVIESIEKGKNCEEQLKKILDTQTQIITMLDMKRKKQLKRLKNDNDSTRTSMLVLNIYGETKHILLYLNSLAKSYASLINSSK